MLSANFALHYNQINMKRILTIILSLGAFASTVHAQTSQGSLLLGGGVSFSSTSYQANDDAKDSNIGVVGQVGYFVSDNFAVGGIVALSNDKVDRGATKAITKNFGIGPFARFYKFTSNDKFAFYAQGSILFGTEKVDNTPGADQKSSSIDFAIAPGFAYFFNQHWAMELQLQGLVVNSSDPNKDVNDDKVTTVSFGVESFNPSVGIKYHFGGK
jgi:outer membrane protein